MAIKAKKSLGQHFLRSKTAIVAIIEAAEITNKETVLEIGPGEGVLTEQLLAKGAQVIAVETDDRCIQLLNERFATEREQGQFTLIHGDIREVAIQERLFADAYLGTDTYKLVANIPYYITGMLFRLFLETLRQPERIIFLVQKEVADEIVARDGKESLLSLSVKVYGTPKIITKVKKEAFSPPPKIDSAVIMISDISRKKLAGLSDEQFFRVLKWGFAARRKMLLGNIAEHSGIPKDELRKIFSTATIAETARGEDVSISEWITLARTVKDITPHE